MRNRVFTRRLSGNEIALGFLIILPAFFRYNTYIASAIVKFIYLTFNLQATESSLNLLLNFVVDLIMCIIAIYVLKPLIVNAYKDFKERKKTLLINGILVGFGICYIASIIGNLLLQVFTTNTQSVNQSAVATMVDYNPYIMSLMTIILAPIGEELVFRGFIFTFLRKYNRVLAYVVSAFLFGFIHVMSSVFQGNIGEMIQMIPYVTMGFAFCFIYEYNNNIFASILAHATQNALATSILLFTTHLL